MERGKTAQKGSLRQSVLTNSEEGRVRQLVEYNENQWCLTTTKIAAHTQTQNRRGVRKRRREEPTHPREDVISTP